MLKDDVGRNVRVVRRLSLHRTMLLAVMALAGMGCARRDVPETGSRDGPVDAVPQVPPDAAEDSHRGASPEAAFEHEADSAANDTVDDRCRAAGDGDLADPHQVLIKVTNHSPNHVYVRQKGCMGPLFRVFGPKGDCSSERELDARCTLVACSCINCYACNDACETRGRQLFSGSSEEFHWSSRFYPRMRREDGTPCVTTQVPVSGVYKIEIPLYADEEAAMREDDPARVISLDIDVPYPGDTISIVIP